MYNIIKNVIQTGNFELSDMLKKIDIVWIKGDIADEQRTELQGYAQDKAIPQNSIDLVKKIEELDKRVKALENNTPSEDETQNEEYPEYVVGKWYYTDNKVTFEDNKYICTAPEGVVCVWSPIEYPAYWQLA